MHDLVIIGGGPGGLTAGIYAQRAKLKTILIEKAGIGGQIALSDVIENYPGFAEISGSDLMQEFEKHAKKFGLEITFAEVTKVVDQGKKKIVKTTAGDYETKSVIVAPGAKPRKLGVKGEKKFTGRGVSYCGTCDGYFFRGQDIVSVGGGDTAIKESIYLAKLANKVSVVHRRDALRAEKIIQEKAFATPKIEFVWDSVVEEIKGNQTVEGVETRNVKNGKRSFIKAQGVFIFIGIIPNTDFLDLKKDERGFIVTDINMETSVKGIFAVGDCRANSVLQVATAVGDAATATWQAATYIESL